MKNFDTRAYSINDFKEWSDRDQLQLSPRFQRRSVWTDKARSFLMDTIVRGKPIPKIFIRQITKVKTRQTVREVVDGQQRLRTILSFLDDGFKISKIHNDEIGGLFFSELSDEIQKAILVYEIAVDLLLDARDEDVLDIFARLNSYSVTLTSQEKLHAKYFGEFKETVYKLALEYHTFWRENRILSDSAILRMAEAELTSDLLIAISDGIHSKKVIESFYKEYDDRFPNRQTIMSRFREAMDFIGELFGDELRSSNFRRQHMFYTLFCSIYHMLHRLPEFDAPRKKVRQRDLAKLLRALESVDETFEKSDDDRTPDERRFMEAARRATTDASVREFRSKYVCELMVDALS